MHKLLKLNSAKKFRSKPRGEILRTPWASNFKGFALVFAPEERRSVATGATRGSKLFGNFAPDGATVSFAPSGATDHPWTFTTGFTRGYTPAPLWGEKLARHLNLMPMGIRCTSPLGLAGQISCSRRGNAARWRIARSGSGDFRTASYGRMNSPSSLL